MKRIIDFLISLLALILLVPFMLILALAVVLDSGWPVFFVQQRIGLRGRTFNIIKFRTMTVLREARHGTFDAGDISRVTRVGRWLRRSKLDELPQIVNVLLGDMSFVGPRPEIKKWVEVYPQRWARVLQVRPGITDSASIEFRNEEEILMASNDPQQTYRDEILPKKLDLYEKYLDNQSLWGDIQIVLRTFFTVICK